MIHVTQISYTFPVNFFFHSSVSAGHIGRRNKSAPIQENYRMAAVYNFLRQCSDTHYR